MDSFHSASDLIKIRRGAVIAWRRASPPAYNDASIYIEGGRKGALFIFIPDTNLNLVLSKQKSNLIIGRWISNQF